MIVTYFHVGHGQVRHCDVREVALDARVYDRQSRSLKLVGIEASYVSEMRQLRIRSTGFVE